MMTGQLLEQAERVFFQVNIEYEDCAATQAIPEDARSLESAPIGDFPKATVAARKTIKKLHSMFPDMHLVELDLDDTPDGYHLLVVDSDGSKVVKVGITVTDYSNETIH
jgi:hypothetical protein